MLLSWGKLTESQGVYNNTGLCLVNTITGVTPPGQLCLVNTITGVTPPGQYERETNRERAERRCSRGWLFREATRWKVVIMKVQDRTGDCGSSVSDATSEEA